MPINILMPALSPTMEKGNIAKWLVKEGNKVASGDVIAEIETDKATMEVEAVDEGVVARIVVAEGTSDVPVNDIIAVLAGEGEDARDASAGPAKPAAVAQGGGETGAAPAQSTAAPVANKSETAPAKPEAASGELMRQGLHDAPKQGNGSRVFASPLARRLARENKLELSALTGSGPHGRIVQRDIEAALKSGGAPV